MTKYNIVRVKVNYLHDEYYAIYDPGYSRTVIIDRFSVEYYVNKMQTDISYGIRDRDINLIETLEKSISSDEIVKVLKCIMLLEI